MRIIHQGKVPAQDVHRLTCSRCKTVFEIERSEGRVTPGAVSDSSSVIGHDCPTCGTLCVAMLLTSKVNTSCPEKIKNNGVCPLHNLHCNYPECEG